MGKQNNKKVNQNRRRALLGTATGAALVASWHKPIVNAVVSPAHAQMSEAEDEFGIEDGTVFIDLNRNERSESASIFDLLVSPAHAGRGTPGRDADVKVTYRGAGLFDYEHVNRRGNVKRSGMVPFGEATEVDVEEDCRLIQINGNDRQGQHSVEIVSANADGVTLQITSDNNNEKNGNSSGETTYFLEPGDAMLETDCDEIIDDNGQNQGNTNGQTQGNVNGQGNGAGNGQDAV